MSNEFVYSGFYGSIEYSVEDATHHGKILCINDVVTYEAETMNGLLLAFIDAVEDYISTLARQAT